MKKILLPVFIFIYLSASAQQHFNDSLSRSRDHLTKGAMITLGSWAVANIASGFLIASQAKGEAKYAWQMNAYWNLINAGLAGMGLAGLHTTSLKHFGLTDNVKAQSAIEKLYVLNIGLDLVYITGGFYMREHGRIVSTQKSMDQWRGYGSSIIIQGAFLLAMDATMYLLHHRNTIRIHNKLQQLELIAGPAALAVAYNF